MAGFLGLDQDLDGLVDLFAGHVALVAVRDVAPRLDGHGGIHNADLGDVENGAPAFELRIEQLMPVLDGTLDDIGTDTQCIGVVNDWNAARPAGRTVVELGIVRPVNVLNLVRQAHPGATLHCRPGYLPCVKMGTILSQYLNRWVSKAWRMSPRGINC